MTDSSPKDVGNFRILQPYVQIRKLQIPNKRAHEDDQTNRKKIKFGTDYLYVDWSLVQKKLQFRFRCQTCSKAFKDSAALVYHEIYHPQTIQFSAAQKYFNPSRNYEVSSLVAQDTKIICPEAKKIRVRSIFESNVPLISDNKKTSANSSSGIAFSTSTNQSSEERSESLNVKSDFRIKIRKICGDNWRVHSSDTMKTENSVKKWSIEDSNSCDIRYSRDNESEGSNERSVVTEYGPGKRPRWKKSKMSGSQMTWSAQKHKRREMCHRSEASPKQKEEMNGLHPEDPEKVKCNGRFTSSVDTDSKMACKLTSPKEAEKVTLINHLIASSEELPIPAALESEEPAVRNLLKEFESNTTANSISPSYEEDGNEPISTNQDPIRNLFKPILLSDSDLEEIQAVCVNLNSTSASPSTSSYEKVQFSKEFNLLENNNHDISLIFDKTEEECVAPKNIDQSQNAEPNSRTSSPPIEIYPTFFMEDETIDSRLNPGNENCEDAYQPEYTKCQEQIINGVKLQSLISPPRSQSPRECQITKASIDFTEEKSRQNSFTILESRLNNLMQREPKKWNDDCTSASDRTRFSERTFSGEKPYRCNHCPLSFSTPDNKVVHERTHKEKPFECLYCEMRFSFELSLNRHMKIHK